MKKKIITYLTLLFVITSIFPIFAPVPGDNAVQPMSFWEEEWF